MAIFYKPLALRIYISLARIYNPLAALLKIYITMAEISNLW
jgi:hypothetical protein